MACKFAVLVALPVVQVGADSSSFSYDVADLNPGDYKSQVKSRVGGNVVDQYSLLDADGTKRTVDYSADDLNGFNAVVRKDAAVITVAPAVVAAAPAVVDAALSIVAVRTFPTVFGAPQVYAAGAVPSIYSSYGGPVVYYY